MSKPPKRGMLRDVVLFANRFAPLALLYASLFQAARAAIVTTGNVTPDPTTTTSSDDLYIGDTADGTMLVDAGSIVTSLDTYLGNEEDVTGSATVDGGGSQLDVTSFTSVANLGTATLMISNGGLVQTDDMEITHRGDADGTVTVTGSANAAPSTLEVLNRLDLGDPDETGGMATLNISAKGHATIGTSFFFAGSYGSTATINASDSGSLLEVGGTYYFGDHGTGTLNLDSGADATSVDVEMGSSSSGIGIANIDGQGTTWAISGQLLVGDVGEGELNITNRGLVSSSNVSIGLNTNATGTATVSGVGSTWDTQNELVVGGGFDAGGTGTLNVEAGATVRVDRTLKIWGDGTVSMTAGTIDAETLDLSAPGSTFEMTGGRLSAEFVQGNLDLAGGTFAPGKTIGVTTVDGDYDQQVGATLQIEIGGTTINRFDQLIVTGDASVVGELDVTLADAGAGLFIPAPEDTFTVLTSASFFGLFTNVANGARLNTTDGLGSFLVEYSPATDTVVLSQFIASILPGDHNGDGTVDAADYALWRSDPSSSGGAQGYTDWVNNFGQTLGSGSETSTPVPEPASELLLILGALLGNCRGLRVNSRVPKLVNA